MSIIVNVKEIHMTENNVVVKGGGTFGVSLFTMGFLTWLILMILNLTGTIAISWFWVWFALWIVPAVGAGLAIIAVIVGLIACLIAAGQSDN